MDYNHHHHLYTYLYSGLVYDAWRAIHLARDLEIQNYGMETEEESAECRIRNERNSDSGHNNNNCDAVATSRPRGPSLRDTTMTRAVATVHPAPTAFVGTRLLMGRRRRLRHGDTAVVRLLLLHDDSSSDGPR
eukprot:scaffold145321_cov43-Attheya_sp.AAC.1